MYSTSTYEGSKKFSSIMHSTSDYTNDSNKSFKNSSSSEDFCPYLVRNYHRSKSLSNISPNSYSSGEIRTIKERLLRNNSTLERFALKESTRKQKITLASLALADFISFCSISIMAPFFPREAAEKGVSNTVSGIIFSFYALVMFLMSPIFGKILPKFGAKNLFLWGMLVAGVSNLLFATLEYVSNYTLFTCFCILIRGLGAVGASAYSTASFVFVVNTFPQNIGSVLGIMETFVGLGMSTGPALGGLLYSLGGFSMPFFVAGIAMISFLPLNIWLLPVVEDCNITNTPPSIGRLIKIPTVVMIGFVVVAVSTCSAFLDPTLEPHLRQFNLTPEKIGLIFLVFSGLYGVSSPAWGWLADRIDNHWSMMVIGLFMCTIGLLLLGPCPYLPFLPHSIWLDLVALSILGISVALTLLPTLQGLLTSALHSGCGDTLSTYSVVAGVWSCLFSLGEVIGPSLGGFLLEHYGFPITSTVMAVITLSLAGSAFFFFVCKNNFCKSPECTSDSGISESWRSSVGDDSSETTPLILSGVDHTHRMYTEEKVQYFEHIRRHENEMSETDRNQVTDVRGTVTITGKGSCEV